MKKYFLFAFLIIVFTTVFSVPIVFAEDKEIELNKPCIMPNGSWDYDCIEQLDKKCMNIWNEKEDKCGKETEVCHKACPKSKMVYDKKTQFWVIENGEEVDFCSNSCAEKDTFCSENATREWHICLQGDNLPIEETQPIENELDTPINNFLDGKSTSQIPAPEDEEDSMTDKITYVPALINTIPTDDDIKPDTLFDKSKKIPLTAVVANLDGNADMMLGDGTWVILKKGDIIPNDAILYTGYDVTMEVRFSDHLVVYMRSLSELSVKQFEVDPTLYNVELKLETGELRFKVLEGTIKTDMKVSTPRSAGAPAGTDVGVSYDKKTEQSIWEIYDGSIAVTSNRTGETKTISSSYGSPIERIEIGQDGSLLEKIAIPRSEWVDFQKQAEQSPNLWLWVIVLIITGCVGYFAYHKREYLAFMIKKT